MPEKKSDRERLVSAVLLLLFLLVAGGTARFVYRETHASDAGQAASDAAVPSAQAELPAAPAAAEDQPRAALLAPKLLNLSDLRLDIERFYPEAERRAGKQARVRLALVVEADGSVSQAEVKGSAGAAFDEAARQVALRMRFEPARKSGTPVAVQIDETVDFALSR